MQLEFYTLAFPKMIDGHREIFVYEEWEPYQLSFLNTECNNPSFHDGETYEYIYSYIYLIWEAKIDDYWQLYYSRFSFCWSDIEEQQLLSGVTISPNPASDELFIENHTEMPLEVSVYDAKGSLMFKEKMSSPAYTIPVLNWPRGFYVVNLFNGTSQLSRKITLE
jgi:hypothetical protein